MFEFECTKRHGAVVEARCQWIHQDAGSFPKQPSTALMILWEAAKAPDPICKELGEELKPFMDRFLGGMGMGKRGDDALAYVKSVEISDRQNFPPGRAFEDGEEDAPAPAATYRIEATDPRWVQHVKVGMRWTSSAYD
jgi:hypothetical protein